jgi:hypothetical protein
VTIASTRGVPSRHDDLISLNVEKARAVAVWLDGVGAALSPADRSAIVADLSDLYVAAAGYQTLLAELLAADTADRQAVADRLTDLGSEIEHIGWHARSVVKRLTRLADQLCPDDHGEKEE